MLNKKLLIVFGGTGFIGKSIVEQYLKNDWRIIIPTRYDNLGQVISEKEGIALGGLNLKNKIDTGEVKFIFNFDILDRKWCDRNNIEKFLNSEKIKEYSDIRIINAIVISSKGNKNTEDSTSLMTKNILSFAKSIKKIKSDSIYLNMGSTSEKNIGSDLYYEQSKKVTRDLLFKSGLCDVHLVAGYVKGRGEIKMTNVAHKIWKVTKFSRKWLFSFSVSILDVDELSKMIYQLLEINKFVSDIKPVEVFATNGEMVFGDLIWNLLSEKDRKIHKRILPKFLEGIFLYGYCLIAPLIFKNNQFVQRLVKFARRSLGLEKRLDTRNLEISQLEILMNKGDYKILETTPFVVFCNKTETHIYIFNKKTKQELVTIVQGSVKH